MPSKVDFIPGLAFVAFVLLGCCASQQPAEILSKPVFQPGRDAVLPLKATTLELVWIQAIGGWVGKYELTADQHRALGFRVRKQPQPAVHGSLPVTMVTFSEAEGACRKLNQLFRESLPTGYVFRLPRGQEFEVFARCDIDRIFPWGNNWPPTELCDGVKPNLLGVERPEWVRNPEMGIPGYSDGWSAECPVEKSGRNEWGLYGVSGNVEEWTVESGVQPDRFLGTCRGGGWYSYRQTELAITKFLRMPAIPGSFGCGVEGSHGFVSVGFRVVLLPARD